MVGLMSSINISSGAVGSFVYPDAGQPPYTVDITVYGVVSLRVDGNTMPTSTNIVLVKFQPAQLDPITLAILMRASLPFSGGSPGITLLVNGTYNNNPTTPTITVDSITQVQLYTLY